MVAVVVVVLGSEFLSSEAEAMGGWVFHMLFSCEMRHVWKALLESARGVVLWNTQAERKCSLTAK